MLSQSGHAMLLAEGSMLVELLAAVILVPARSGLDTSTALAQVGTMTLEESGALAFCWCTQPARPPDDP